MGFHTLDRMEGGLVDCQHLIQVAEAGKEGLSQRLNVAPGDTEGQEKFEDGRISARRGIAVEKPLAQPLTVAGFAIVAIIHNRDTRFQKQSRAS